MANRPPSAAATTRTPRPIRLNLNLVSLPGLVCLLLSVQTLNPKPRKPLTPLNPEPLNPTLLNPKPQNTLGLGEWREGSGGRGVEGGDGREGTGGSWEGGRGGKGNP